MPTTITIPTAGLTANFKGITALNIGNYIAYLKSTGQANDNATALSLAALQQSLTGLDKALANGNLTASVTSDSLIVQISYQES